MALRHIYLPILTFALVSWAAAAVAEITVTHPRHYDTPPKRTTSEPAAVPHGRVKHPAPRPGVLMRSRDSLRDGNWQLDKVLSRQCREGSFVQRRDRRYVVVLDGRTYGAATDHRATLLDRRGLAAPETIYVFHGQGTTNCRVYHRGDVLQPLR